MDTYEPTEERTEPPIEFMFRQWVKRMAHMGYGSMMTIVAEEWWKSAIQRNDPVSGIFVGYPIGLLPKEAEREMMREMEIRTGMKPKRKATHAKPTK